MEFREVKIAYLPLHFLFAKIFLWNYRIPCGQGFQGYALDIRKKMRLLTNPETLIRPEFYTFSIFSKKFCLI
jgi:hypothetical protein